MTGVNFDIAIVNDLLVNVPGGEIDLRDDRIKRQWKEKVNTFSIGKYPVTQDFYFALTKENPSTFRGADKPVETVTWIEAINFCNSLSTLVGLDLCYNLNEDSDLVTVNMLADGFRLPTEAEWQYACQGGAKNNLYGELDSIAWYKANSKGTTHNVGLKRANQYGIYDMLGNVWEWCSDIYDETVYGSYRIFRGVGWCDESRNVMATTRRRRHPRSFKIEDLGFRIARN